MIPGDDEGIREFIWRMPLELACEDANYAIQSYDIYGRPGGTAYLSTMIPKHKLIPEGLGASDAPNSKVYLYWQPLPNCQNTPSGHYAIHFQVRRAQTNSCADPAPGSYPTLLGTVSTAASTEFLTGQPAANTAYWYIVQAEWSDGLSSASAPACWPGGGQSKNDSLPGGIRWPSSERDFRIAAAGSVGRAKREARDYGLQDFVPSSHRLIGQSGGANPAVSLYFYHLDHLGTPRVITDVNGNVVSRHKYLPFGEEMSPPLSSNTHKFTGHERDKETGLDYMLARYYSSSLGRFMAVDPSGESVELGNPQSWNRYVYASNNPLRFVDPDGEASTESQVREKITAEATRGGVDPVLALAVARTESNFSQSAVNVNKDGTKDVGVFQINSGNDGRTFAGTKIDVDKAEKDEDANIKQGVAIVKEANDRAKRENPDDPDAQAKQTYKDYNGGASSRKRQDTQADKNFERNYKDEKKQAQQAKKKDPPPVKKKSGT